MEENLNELVEAAFYKIINHSITSISTCDFFYRIKDVDIILSLVPRSEKVPEENKYSTVEDIVKNPVWYTGCYLTNSSATLFDFNLRIGAMSYTVPRPDLISYANCINTLNAKIKEYQYKTLNNILNEEL